MQIVNGGTSCLISYSGEEESLLSRYLVSSLYNGIPLVVGLVASVTAYIFAIKKVRRLPQSFLSQVDINFYKLLWYPVLMLIVFVPPFVNNMMEVNVDARDLFYIQLFDIILNRSIGFLHAIAYGLQVNSHQGIDRRSALSSAIISSGVSGASAEQELAKAHYDN